MLGCWRQDPCILNGLCRLGLTYIIAFCCTTTGVVLLAATNRPDVLDPALTRPGRLSRKVVVPLPDQAGRAAILGVHLKEVPLEGGTAAQDVAAAQLAAVTPNFSGGCAFQGVSAGPVCGVGWVTGTAGVQHLLRCI